MSNPVQAEPLPRRTRRLIGERREYLVNRRYQFKGALTAVALSFVLLVGLNLLFFAYASASSAQALANAPELEQLFRSQDRAQIALTALASVVFLGGVFAISLFESHRTAGAAFNLERCIGRVRDGELGVRAMLRRGDHLRELETAFNEMVGALRTDVERELETLNSAIGELDPRDPRTAQAVASLRHLAEERRRRLQ